MNIKNVIAFILLLTASNTLLQSVDLTALYQRYVSYTVHLIFKNEPRYTLAQKIGDLKFCSSDEETLALIKLSLDRSMLEVAHGLARQLINTHQWTTHDINCLRASNPEVVNLIKKQYFLMTKEASVMQCDGQPLTLTFREVVCSKAIMILNGKADFSHLFLDNLDMLEIYAHPSLKELDLSGNYLTRLPETIKRFTGLKILLLNNNRLETLPDNLGTLTNLIRLDLQNNQLTELPVSLGNLNSLWRINLDANKLVSLPKTMANLQSLTWLSARNNRLPPPPAWLKAIPTLRKVQIDGN